MSSGRRIGLGLGGVVVAVVLMSGVGCGDDDGGNAGAGGAGGSGGSGMPVIANGCNSTTAVDMTASPTIMIAFAGIEYTPQCVRIRAGTNVVFAGNFANHPLVGGTVAGMTGTPDSASPIPATNSGSELTFTLSQVGAFPYYCTAHASSGMMGAIFVESK